MRLSEKKIIWLIIIATVIVANLPIVYGWLIAPPGYSFTGIRSWVPGDILVYYSYIEQVREGNFLFEDRFTTEQGIQFLNIFWLAVGLLSRVFNIVPALALFFLRVVLTPILLFLIYRLIIFFRGKNHASILLLFLICASGVGVYYAFVTNLPSDYYAPLDIAVPEFNLYQGIVNSPHVIVTTILILVVFYLSFRAMELHSYRYAAGAGLAALIMFQYHPYYVPLVYGVVGAYYVVQYIRIGRTERVWSFFGPFVVIVAVSFPSVLYGFYLFFNDGIYLYRALDNMVAGLPLPVWYVFLMSYGLLFPLAGWGLWLRFRRRFIDSRELFLLTWFVVQGILIIFPLFGYQRKLLLTWFFPLYLYAWDGFLATIVFLRSRSCFSTLYRKAVWFAVLTFVLIPTFIFNAMRDYILYRDPTPDLAALFFISPDRKQAYRWLKDNLSLEDALLSFGSSGTLITGFTGRRVYYGHDSESIFVHQEKFPLTELFFSDVPDNEWRSRFVMRKGIDYVWWGPTEQERSSFQPSTATFLRPVFQNDEVTVYAVTHE